MIPPRWAVLSIVAALTLARPAASQIALYEGRLPDGFAYVRFANTTDVPMELRPSFTDPVKLGVAAGDRISPYRVVEGVADKKLTLDSGGGSVAIDLAPGSFHTFLLTSAGPKLAGTMVTDVTEYNQLRAKLSFYNASPGCSTAGLLLEPSGQPIFAAVGSATMRTRSINPAASATVRAMCAAARVPDLDLGELNEGALYSVWLMAPHGTPAIFLAQDTITAYRR